MEYEDLVEGYEDSLLLPFVAIARQLRAEFREGGLLGIAKTSACVAVVYVFMWLAFFWASL